MQLTTFAIALIVFQIGSRVANLAATRQDQAIDGQIGPFAVHLRAGLMPGQPRPQQETVAGNARRTRHPHIIMGEVVTRRRFKRQLIMRNVAVFTRVDGQTGAAEMRALIQTDIVFNYRSGGVRADLQIVTMVNRIQYRAVAGADVQQIQRLFSLYASGKTNLRALGGQTLGKMQEDVRLNRSGHRQRRGGCRYFHLIRAPVGVAEFGTQASVDEHHPPRIQRQ